MAHAQLIEAFPRRPIALVKPADRGTTHRNALIIILLLFLPGLYWGWSLWQDQQLREFLRTRGVEADVWLDGRQPIFTPPALYDPADPSRVMLKPEAERDLRWSEWIGVPFALAIPLAGLLLWLFGRKHQLEGAVGDPRPVTVPVEKMVRRGALLEVWFREPAGKERLQVFPQGKMPYLVNPPPDDGSDRPWALALLSPRGRPVLLDNELSELELSDEERRGLLGRA